MSEITQKAIFTRELQRRLDELINWIVESAPDKTTALAKKDFAEVRQSVLYIASCGVDVQVIEPEPEAGGAQYINDNPAPWP